MCSVRIKLSDPLHCIRQSAQDGTRERLNVFLTRERGQEA